MAIGADTLEVLSRAVGLLVKGQGLDLVHFVPCVLLKRGGVLVDEVVVGRLSVLVETAIDLAIEADLLIRLHEFDKEDTDSDIVSRKMPVYLTIFALAQCVSIFLSLGPCTDTSA